MPGERLKIHFDDLGLATVLERHQLIVPRNQRSYAWEPSHVKTLFQDFSTAKNRDDPTYFLGTIVLTQAAGEFEVADGQQRLATTAILISAIRDYLHEFGDGARRAAAQYTSALLLQYDPRKEENLPKLRLNSVDAEYFVRTILSPPDDPARQFDRPIAASSHQRLHDASALAVAHVHDIVAQYPRAQHARILYDWIDFLRTDAIVIVIEVPDHIDAFRMFETLNDRGLRASQIDILKNYLFSLAGDRVAEVEALWISMVSVVESVGNDDLVLDCVRHSWIVRSGPTTEAELAKRIKERITSRQQAMDFITELDTTAVDYIALLNPLHHPRWDVYDREARAYLAVLTTVLGVEQIRPLLMAVARRFEPAEAKSAFSMFVSWSVRSLVAGGGGGGVLDRHYGLRAAQVNEGIIRTAAECAQAMVGIVRGDEAFEAAFRTHTVSKSNLARYYLRALELRATGDNSPALGGVDDPNQFNLEHVIPQKPDDEWGLDPLKAQAYYKRLGNMVLLAPNENVRIGNKVFDERRKVYADCPFVLTQDVAEAGEWGVAGIDERQAKLARLAVATWPL